MWGEYAESARRNLWMALLIGMGLSSAFVPAALAQPLLLVDAEGGAAFTAYNEVRAGNLDVLGPALPTDQIATAADEFGDLLRLFEQLLAALLCGQTWIGHLPQDSPRAPLSEQIRP